MDYFATEESRPARNIPALHLAFARFVGTVRHACRMPRLDFEAMPDRVKRDLGFSDGREPRYEDPLSR